MNYQWIAGGTTLLACTLLLKLLQQRGSFQTLIISFIFAWSTFAAFHFWGTFQNILTYFFQPELDEKLLTVGTYWLSFVVAALPGLVLFKTWIRNYKTTFPPLIDGLILWTLSTTTSIIFLFLVLMSTSISGVHAKTDGKIPAEKVLQKLAKVPIQLYLAAADYGTEEEESGSRQNLPQLARFFSRP